MEIQNPDERNAMSIGIPYARTVAYVGPYPVISCPECGVEILLSDLKDNESFSRREYQDHYAAEHESQTCHCSNCGDDGITIST
jgi:hypothetical protein